MKIQCENVGKRFSLEWVFRNFNYTFQTNEKYAIIGSNGSGKSTLLQCLMGIMPINTGTISYNKENNIEAEEWYRYLAFASPYQELIEDFTISEILDFHSKFKNGLEKNEILERAYFKKEQDKTIKFLSSGMKQRLKLALAFYYQSEILILDEPSSNLDQRGIDWFLEEVNKFSKNKILIIASNEKRDYVNSNFIIDINTFKKK